ncbi:MAG: CPBP family glutamic-type intramembrane protease [Terriglobales bacterium]
MVSRADPSLHLNLSDWRLIAIAVAVAAASLWVVNRDFHRAFPQAAIDFQVSSATAPAVAQTFLKGQGIVTAGYHHAQQFGYDDTTLIFLERELGLPRTEALLRNRLHLWRWQNRWFRPLQQQEYQVAVSARGQVVGFSHVIANGAPGARLSQAAARALAVRFLTATLHLDPAHWVEVDEQQQVRPRRLDYVFVWKDRAPLEAGSPALLQQAQHRYRVRIQGATVGAYEESVLVPEAWQRAYSRLRSKNETAGLVDWGLLLILGLGMVFVLVMRAQRRDLRWRAALWIGGAGAVLKFLASLNRLGAASFGYSTTQSWASFLLNLILNDLAAAVGVGVLLLVLTAAAESLYRERFGGLVALPSFLSWRGVRSKSFLLSMVLGLALAAFFFAYQTVFYLIANHFGAWAPADIPYDALLNTRLPWAFVLFSGFFPAISEEFGFRMLAIPLLEKWFRYLWVAVIAASFLWGFGHATYPNQPFYIRGVEVGLGGILLSWIMIRFGILTTVVWHYTVDALYTALLLLRAHDAYLRWSGASTALLALAPLLVAIVAYWRCHGFAPEAELTNAALGSRAAAPPDTTPEPVVAAAPSYAPTPGANWTIGVIIAGVLLSAFAVPLVSWNHVLPWRSSPAQAVSAARKFLAAHGYEVGGYRSVVRTGSASTSARGPEEQAAADAVFQHLGRRALLRAFSGSAVAASWWAVRFYRRGQPEEFTVRMRADTLQVVAFAHAEAETAPGASPSMRQAGQAAAAFLMAQKFSAAGMRLLSAQQQARPARTDTAWVWEAAVPGFPTGVTHRVGVGLHGTQIAQFASWYHVSQASLRSYARGGLGTSLLSAAQGLLYAAAFALLLLGLYEFLRHRPLRWPVLIAISIAAAIAALVISANALPTAASAYPTTMPWRAFLLAVGIAALRQALEVFVATLALLAAAAMAGPRLSALFHRGLRHRLVSQTGRDAFWTGLVALAWVAGGLRTQAAIAARWHVGAAVLPAPPAGLTHGLPGLSGLVAAPLHALWIACGLGVLLAALFRAWRSPQWRWWAVGGVALLWAGRLGPIHSSAQLAQQALFSALTLVLVLGFGRLFLRDNPLAYVSAALLPLLVLPAAQWLQLPQPAARAATAALLALATLWLAWLAWSSRAAETDRGEAARA